MFNISTFHLLLVALLYIAVYVTEAQDDSSEDMTTGLPLAMDEMSATDSFDDDDSSDDDSTGLPLAMDDDDGDDGFDATDSAVVESAEDPEADVDDDDDDESAEDTTTTEEPSMELTEGDDVEDDSDETEDFIVENTTTTVPPEMDIGSAEDLDNDDGVATDRRDDFREITGESGNDPAASSHPATSYGLWAALAVVMGLVAILVGCGLVYSYRRYKWDGTEAAMKRVVALQMTDELNVAETEDAEFNKEAPASTYDFAHEEDQDALISSDDGKYRGENVDFLDDTHETNAALIIID